MSTLVEFLLDRIAEDEVIRRRILDRAGYAKVAVGGAVSYVDPHADRLLAECEAKRRIVELHFPEPFADAPNEMFCRHDQRTAGVWPCDTMRLLALPFADHPDYDEVWRP